MLWCGEGVTSFKLFMAYPGVFMLDDASIFRALADHREQRRPDLHARRKWKCDRRHRAASAGGRERPRRNITLLLGPPPRKRKPSRVRLHLPKWQELRSTLCIELQ